LFKRTFAHDSARVRFSQPAFLEDLRGSAERQAVEFEVDIGEHHGVRRVPQVAFQRLLRETPTPSRSKEARYLQGTRFESIAERKPRPRLLT